MQAGVRKEAEVRRAGWTEILDGQFPPPACRVAEAKAKKKQQEREAKAAELAKRKAETDAKLAAMTLGEDGPLCVTDCAQSEKGTFWGFVALSLLLVNDAEEAEAFREERRAIRVQRQAANTEKKEKMKARRAQPLPAC